MLDHRIDQNVINQVPKMDKINNKVDMRRPLNGDIFFLIRFDQISEQLDLREKKVNLKCQSKIEIE